MLINRYSAIKYIVMVAVRWGGTMEVRNGDKEVNGK
jgi:hypothetical protein